ncbi:hypothetical protein [Spirosoma sp.]|uniref:hypothetical protein n=1 Tax=Spirosoma sp. TaxID=1899569 RepID=UPI003B3B3BE5
MKYLVLFLCFLSLPTLAQIKLPANESGQVQYQEIVRVPDSKRPARQLMEQARAWGEQHYRSNLTTEQQFDQEHNILFIRSSYLINNQTIRYTLTIEPKFGRYRATLTDLVAENNGMNIPVRPSSVTVDDIKRIAADSLKNNNLIEETAQRQADLYDQLDKSCRATLASLKAVMTDDN